MDHKKDLKLQCQYNVGSPIERVAIAVADSLDINRYFVVVMEYFRKWVEAYALPNQETVVEKPLSPGIRTNMESA